MKSRYTRSTARQWEIMKKFLPVKINAGHELREIADAVLFPKWENVYYHFRKWGRDGTLKRLNAGPDIIERQHQAKEETPSMLSIDSKSVKAGPFMAV